MKKIILAGAVMLAGTAALAQGSHPTSGYVRSNGTYVAPSGATNPNTTQTDNFSTRGNVNPYSGAVGTRTPRY